MDETSTKRKELSDEDNDSDSSIGPMPNEATKPKKKKGVSDNRLIF